MSDIKPLAECLKNYAYATFETISGAGDLEFEETFGSITIKLSPHYQTNTASESKLNILARRLNSYHIPHTLENVGHDYLPATITIDTMEAKTRSAINDLDRIANAMRHTNNAKTTIQPLRHPQGKIKPDGLGLDDHIDGIDI